jgi:parvulin-like peptidyl-prolyl isomerase
MRGMCCRHREAESPRSRKNGARRAWTILALATFVAAGCARDERNTLARVGNVSIRGAQFARRFQEARRRFSLPDNLQTRRSVLEQMIEEQLLIAEAKRRGFDRDGEAKHELDRIRIQELLNLYLETRVFPHVSVSEDELAEFYRRLNTRVRVRHLYAASRSEAESLLVALMRGRGFDELAREVFSDPQLRDTGGDLGYFTAGDMDPAFEDAAFTAEIGKIVGPIRTAQGYSILRVEDRVTHPFLTESEYVRRRPSLLSYCLREKKRRAAQAHADSLRSYLDLRFNEEALWKLFQLIKNRGSAFWEDGFPASGQDGFWSEELVRSRLGRWDVRTFAEHARFTSETQRSWIRNPENLQDFAAGLVIRAYLLEEARKLGLHRRPEYKQNVAERWEEYLLKRVEAALDSSMVIPADSLAAFYSKYSGNFREPERLRLAMVVLEDSQTVATVARLLAGGARFEEVARRYSVDRRSASRDGEAGLFTRAELGPYADRLFALRAGSWMGPVQIGSRWFFFQSLERLPGRQLSFEEARAQVYGTLKPFWRQRMRKELLERLRSQVTIVRHDEKLRSVQVALGQNEGSRR